jgi:hypothetical protein
MRSRTPLVVLALVAVAPLVVTTTVACGGKMIAEGTSSEPAAAAGGTTAPTSVPTTAWPPCAADSTPVPMPASPEPELLDLCTKACDRTFDCLRCSYGSCLPSCMLDGLATRECAKPFVAWRKCVLSHPEQACGAVPECDPQYCEYLRCGSAPGAPTYPQCR